MIHSHRSIAEVLAAYQPLDPAEAADVARVRALVDAERDPWSQSLPLHITASAVIVHPPTERVLLRWHARQQDWLHVGGHGDPGETAPLDVALREGAEETGLTDLVPWPDDSVVHLVVVPVAPKGNDPAHEHADVRFALATGNPDAARPEKPGAELRWLTLSEAHETTTKSNIRETLSRLATRGIMVRS